MRPGKRQARWLFYNHARVEPREQVWLEMTVTGKTIHVRKHDVGIDGFSTMYTREIERRLRNGVDVCKGLCYCI